MKRRPLLPVLLSLLAAALTVRPAYSQRVISEDAWGTSSQSILRTHASGFQSFTAGQDYLLQDDLTCLALAPSWGGCAFNAPLELPTGVLLEKIGIDACNAHATASVVLHLFRCGTSAATCTLVASVERFPATGCGRVDLALTSALAIDNDAESYYLRADLQPVAEHSFRSALFYYRRAVSEPPGTATFDDVPLGHARREYVEALYAAGLTKGCDGVNFCPDNPVTRAQLAEVLSRALGMHFPD